MMIESLLKRAFPGLVLALLGVAAYLQARGLAQLVSLALWAEGAAATPAPRVPPARGVEKSGNAILARNPFDSETGSLTRLPAAGGAPAEAPPDPLSWPACPGVQVVIVSESRDPWWSLTSVKEAGHEQARLHRVGDRVAGKQLAFIGFNPREQAPAIWLEDRGGSCQSVLFRAPVAVDAPVGGTPAVTPTAERPLARVARATVDATLRDPSTSLRSVRVVPEHKDGVVVGLRLFGIRPGTLLGSVGIKNGDRLESINGFSIATPAQAIEAYAHLVRAQRLDVHLVRAGAPLELSLNID